MARESNRNTGASSAKSRDELLWLETYFIVFPTSRRPTLAQVEDALASADPHLKLDNLEADDDGLFASLLVQSPEDHAAVEISYESGDAVIEQNLEWAKQLQKQISPKQLQLLVAADARLDVAHFERVEAGAQRQPIESPKTVDPGAKKATGPRLHDEHDEFGGDDSFDDPAFDDEIDEEAAMEDFDPTCLLTVVETLSVLTRGLAYDPAAGEVL